MTKIRTVCAATVLMLSTGLIATPPALASACTGQTAGPLYVAFCHDSDFTPGGALPQIRLHQDPYNPDAITVFLDVPEGSTVESVAIRYAVGDDGNEVRVPVGLTRGSHCVFYAGPKFASPGGCLLGIERG